MFFGAVPDILFGKLHEGTMNTIHPIEGLGSLIKSNGIFLGEPSDLLQIIALGILIEVLEFRRPQYLCIMAFGFLTAYSGVDDGSSYFSSASRTSRPQGSTWCAVCRRLRNRRLRNRIDGFVRVPVSYRGI